MRSEVLFVVLVIFCISFVSANGNESNQSSVNMSINETFEVINIADIIPHEAPMLVPVTFVVLVEGNESDFSYSWDFGDGSVIEGSDKFVHTYSKLGLYELEVVVSNLSDSVSKSVFIRVVSPVGSINKTISDFKNKLERVEEEIDKLPDWVSEEINEITGVDKLRSDIEEQENKTKDGIGEQEAVDIMEKLYELEIPERFRADLIINKVNFIMDVEMIDLDVLEEIGAGSFGEDKSKYDKAISNWVRENLELKVESKSYKLYYEDKEEDILSYVKVSLIPKKSLDDIYFVVEGIAEEGFQSYENVAWKKLNLDEEVSVEFLTPDRVSVQNVPVYLSPKESELDLGFVVDICNNDGTCDSEENYGNCPNDCKRWFGSGLMLIGLLILALIIYIILQEWYKRYYERHLFPDRNQLFNLVHFMNNSLNQGLDKSKIFSKLKDIDWKGEQLNYAWKKLHGCRTGMFEIPVFKWFENRKVKMEIEKRGGKVGYREFRV